MHFFSEVISPRELNQPGDLTKIVAMIRDGSRIPNLPDFPPKKCMKLRKFWSVGGRGHAPGAPPLRSAADDPRVHLFVKRGKVTSRARQKQIHPFYNAIVLLTLRNAQYQMFVGEKYTFYHAIVLFDVWQQAKTCARVSAQEMYDKFAIVGNKTEYHKPKVATATGTLLPV